MQKHTSGSRCSCPQHPRHLHRIFQKDTAPDRSRCWPVSRLPGAASPGTTLGGRMRSLPHSSAKATDGIRLSRDVVLWHKEHECPMGNRFWQCTAIVLPSTHRARRQGVVQGRPRGSVRGLGDAASGQERPSWRQGRGGEGGGRRWGNTKALPPGAKAAARGTPALSPNPPPGLPLPGQGLPPGGSKHGPRAAGAPTTASGARTACTQGSGGSLKWLRDSLAERRRRPEMRTIDYPSPPKERGYNT